MKIKTVLFLILLFTVINSTVYYITKIDFDQKIDLILHEKINIVQTHYNIILESQKHTANAFYKSIVSNTDVLDLLEKSYDQNEKIQKKNREKLYTQLHEEYKVMQNQGVLQVQFVFKDNHSFLRMHKPARFGDNVTAVRQDFAYTQRTHKGIRGFTQGRTAHGFRNIFPLFKDNKYLGAVEISFSSQILEWYLNNISSIHTHFLVNKNLFDAKTWERNDLVIQYTQSAESKDYMLNLNTIHTKQRCVIENKKKLAVIADEIEQKIALGKSFAQYVDFKERVEVMSFIPVKNISNKVVAWIVSYEEDNTIENNLSSQLLIQISVFLLSLLIIYLLLREMRVNMKLRQKKEEAEENIRIIAQKEQELQSEKIKLKSLFQNIPDLLWLKDPQGVYLACNKRFEDFFGATETQIVGNTDYSFISEELATFFRENDQRAMNSETPVSNFEEVTFASDQHKELLFTTKSKIVDINGKDIGILGISKDLTELHHYQNKILYEKNFISTIIDNANAIIAVIDASGTMIKINAYGENFTGMTQKELAQQPYLWKKFLPPFLKEKAEKIVKNWNQGIFTKNFQHTWISKENEERLFEWSNMLVQKKDGSMDYFATIGIDITIKEKQREFFKTIFNTSKDGLAILDLESRFLEFNSAYLKMTGFTREELLATTCIDLSLEEDKENSIKVVNEAILNGHVENFEKTCVVKNEKLITVNMSVALMPDTKSLLISTKDITQRNKEKKELEKAKYKAEKANKSKSEFLANMSHEIRTPLNGMIGLTKLTLETELTPLQKEYLQKGLSSSKLLLNIINDILDYSKIEADKINIMEEIFLLDMIVQNISDLFSYQAKAKNLEYSLRCDDAIPKQLIGDDFRITQVLTNLIGNSIKFTQKGSVTIDIKLLQKNDTQVQIECLVQDTGIGISLENQEKLFRAFEQGDNSTTKNFGGTGLGLLISKKLIELMGGEIWMQSVLNQGTTFGFRLWLGYTVKTLQDQSQQLLSQQFLCEKYQLVESKRALLVEDNETNQFVALKLLTNIGFEVDIAVNGEESIQKVRAKHYDIVFMDIHMPIMDGHEASVHIREFDTTTPIIALSAAVLPEDKLQSSRSKMDGHLSKPIDDKELLKVLQLYFSLETFKKSQSFENAQVDIKGINIQKFQNELELEAKEAYRYYEQFRKNYQQEFVLFLENKDSDEYIKAFIHKLKGTTGNMKIDSLYNLCVQTEENDYTLEYIEKIIAELEFILTQIETQITPLLVDQIAQKEPRDFDIILAMILEKLELYELIEDELIEEFIHSAKNSMTEESIQNIEQLFKENATEELVEILKNI